MMRLKSSGLAQQTRLWALSNRYDSGHGFLAAVEAVATVIKIAVAVCTSGGERE